MRRHFYIKTQATYIQCIVHGKRCVFRFVFQIHLIFNLFRVFCCCFFVLLLMVLLPQLLCSAFVLVRRSLRPYSLLQNFSVCFPLRISNSSTLGTILLEHTTFIRFDFSNCTEQRICHVFALSIPIAREKSSQTNERKNIIYIHIKQN